MKKLIFLYITLILSETLCFGQDSLSIAFTGDILLDRGVRKKIEVMGVDAIFSHSIDSLFATCDKVVGNLECPATKIKQPVYKRFIFRTEPEWLEALQRHGITHLNLANNHSIDQGRQGLLDTKSNIEKAGMMPIGAGRNMQEASQPVLLSDTPRHVYLIASERLPLENYAPLPHKPCVSQEDFDTLCLRISTLRQKEPEACIIVSLHWGWEHTLTPTLTQRQQAHDLIDAGADLLVCHHTHTLQTIEQYRGKTIYYSIGNFIFDLTKPINTRTCVVKVVVTKDKIKTITLPVEIRQCVPHIANFPSIPNH